ncbi:MAG TPA: hypothetical protein VF903_06210 [Nitrospirota bacterium]
MDYDPVFSQKPTAELNVCLSKYSEEHENYVRAAAELSKREKEAEERIEAQFTRVVFWSRLAAILALPGALYVLWQIVRPLR